MGRRDRPGSLAGLVTAGELERLQDELVAARAEIVRLEEENDRLRLDRPEAATASVHRSQRAPRLFSSPEEAVVAVDGSSPPHDKVRLFRSLFTGRADVYAERWENQSKKKSGWSPVTLDGHQAQVPRRYAPMDDAVVGAHLSGRITAGVYPLIDGDRCCFLACDFDKGSWLLDALAFLEVCNEAYQRAWSGRARATARMSGSFSTSRSKLPSPAGSGPGCCVRPWHFASRST
jgi:hypothetical protein